MNLDNSGKGTCEKETSDSDKMKLFCFPPAGHS